MVTIGCACCVYEIHERITEGQARRKLRRDVEEIKATMKTLARENAVQRVTVKNFWQIPQLQGGPGTVVREARACCVVPSVAGVHLRIIWSNVPEGYTWLLPTSLSHGQRRVGRPIRHH